ncbi:hypothetical protein ANCCAN_13390, partial [Ancylostoma caninum]
MIWGIRDWTHFCVVFFSLILPNEILLSAVQPKRDGPSSTNGTHHDRNSGNYNSDPETEKQHRGNGTITPKQEADQGNHIVSPCSAFSHVVSTPINDLGVRFL